MILFVTESIGRDADDMEDAPNQNYRKQPVLLMSNHFMFTIPHSLTSCSLP
jgi:hypothetical protein